MELVSIVVPVYNVENYLDRCLESILNQTYQNIEIILVDDGSIDKSGEKCDAYLKKDSRIKVIHKSNEGLGYARNSGMCIAKGKFITFIDSDDFIGPDHIRKMYEMIIDTKSDTCLAGHTKLYQKSKKVFKNVCAGKVIKKEIVREILPRMCGADQKGQDYIEMSVCMCMFSNELIQKYQLMFKSERNLISEDLVFNFEYFPLSKGVCVCDSTDYYYCDNENSLTTKYRKNRFSDQVVLYKYIRTKAKDLEIEELCLPRLNNTLLAIARHSIKLEYKFLEINGKKTVKENIHKICENKLLIKVLNDYDDKGLKMTTRIVNFFIKNKMYLLIKLVMNFKNKLNI